METNMGLYERIFIRIFPNGEKLETTYIPDTENCLIYGGHIGKCSQYIYCQVNKEDSTTSWVESQQVKK